MLHAFEFFGETVDARLDCAEDTVLEIVEDEGAPILYFETEFATPLGQGAVGHAEFGGHPDEAPAVGAELDKLLHCFLVFHKKRRMSELRTACRQHTNAP